MESPNDRFARLEIFFLRLTALLCLLATPWKIVKTEFGF